MFKWERAFRALLNHLNSSSCHLDPKVVSNFCTFLLETERRNGTLYLVAAGRSLDVLRIFGARLMQEPISLETRSLALSPKPRIENMDAALICTGTGETAPVLSMAESWLKINSNIALITSLAAERYQSHIFETVSRLKVLPKALILLPGITKEDIVRRRKNPTQIHSSLDRLLRKGRLIPSPTKFELTALLFLESVVTELYYVCKEGANDTLP